MKSRSRALGIMAVALAAAGVVWWMRRPVPAAPSSVSSRDSSAIDERERAPLASTPHSAAGHRAASDPPTHPSATETVDRKKYEAMRQLIWQSFGRTPPPVASPSSTKGYVLPKEPPPPPDGDAGAIEPKYIQEHVRSEFFDMARGCYATAAPRLSNPRGRVVFWFTIVGDEKVGGVVDSVDVLDESTLRDPDMIECMRESFFTVTFPPPKGGGWVTVKYPIEFSPDDEE